MDTVRIRAKIYGRVQGVFFRRSTRHVARKLGLVGFVRNEPDGTVMLEVEGESGMVEKLLTWAESGPPLARVDRIEKEEVPAVKEGVFDITW